MNESATLHANTLQPTTLVSRAKEIIFQKFDNELLAVDAQTSICYSLNESAGDIWELIAMPTALGAICTHLCQEYDVDEATCLVEVKTVLQALQQAGLIKTTQI